MSTDILATIGENFLAVASFLDMSGVAVLNQACLFDPQVIACLWEGAAVAALKNSPVWGPSAQSFIAQTEKHYTSPKQHAQNFSLLRRTIFPPTAWEPWITKTSFCSLNLLPKPQFWEGEIPEIPYPAAVPISIGAFRGHSLVVGITLMPEGHLDSNICLGVEGRNSTMTMPIMIAPFSGHFFIQYAEGPIMRALAFQPLDYVPVSLRIWIHVFDSGAFRFLRQLDGQQTEDAGILPSECLPLWINEYFACVYHWGQALTAAVTVSVEVASDKVPSWLSDMPASEMNVKFEMMHPEVL